MSRNFGAIIIGDELMSGKRQDKHFAKIAEMLGERGLILSWLEYLGDDRARLAATFKRTMAAGDVVFSCGGIGNTPDDHTRQAVAAALGVSLELHAAAFEELNLNYNKVTDEVIRATTEELINTPMESGQNPDDYFNQKHLRRHNAEKMGERSRTATSRTYASPASRTSTRTSR